MSFASSGLNQPLLIAQQQLERGNVEYASEILADLLAKNPGNLDAHHLMSMAKYLIGDLDSAIGHCRIVIEQAVSDEVKIPVLNNLGNFLKAKGDMVSARKAYQEILLYDRKCFPALYNLGNVEAALGEPEKAIKAFQQAIKVDSNYLDSYYNMGMELSRLGRLEEALEAFQKAVGLRSEHVEAITQLGTTYFKLGLIEKSVETFARAVTCENADSSVYNNYGVALTSQGNLELAVEILAKAVQMSPDDLSTRCNLGVAQSASGDQDAAILSFRTVIKREPLNFDALKNLGVALHRKGLLKEAIDYFRKVLDLDPGSTETMVDLASCLYEQDQQDEAIEIIEQSRESGANKSSLVPLFASMIMRINRFPSTEDEHQGQYDAFIRDLEEIEGLLASELQDSEEAYTAISFGAPYRLAFYGKNLKEIQIRLGSIYERVMSSRYPALGNTRNDLPPLPGDEEKIRVGIVSSFFYDHSVYATVTKSFLDLFFQNRSGERNNFEVHGYSLLYPGASSVHSPGSIIETSMEEYGLEGIKKQFAYFGEFTDFDSLVRKVDEDRLHILIYPSIGFVADEYKLASLRLAPLQLSAWGFPLSSGLKTIDARLSPEALERGFESESESNADRFLEKVIPVPGIGLYHEPLATDSNSAPLSSAWFSKHGLDDKSTKKILCVQPAETYQPQFDQILVEIARDVPDCQFVFLGNESFTRERLKSRLARNFESSGIDAAKHLVFLPRLEADQYRSLCQAAQLYLDNPVSSGVLPLLEALDAGILPIAFKHRSAGSFLSSGSELNPVAGILRHIGMEELVADTAADYVKLASDIINDGSKAERIKSRLKSNLGKIHRDGTVTESLLHLVLDALKSTR